MNHFKHIYVRWILTRDNRYAGVTAARNTHGIRADRPGADRNELDYTVGTALRYSQLIKPSSIVRAAHENNIS